MKELLKFLITSLIEGVAVIEIKEKITKLNANYMISISGGDIGRLIGKKGRTIKAIRVLTSAVEKKFSNKIVSVEIIDRTKNVSSN